MSETSSSSAATALNSMQGSYDGASDASVDGGDAVNRKTADNRRRMLCFVTSFIITIVSGTQYAISVYSVPMKILMNWNQKQLSLVETISGIGLFFGYFMGFIFDYYGPQKTIALSAILTMCGYIILGFEFYFAPFYAWPQLSAILSTMMFFILGQGANGSNCVAIALNLKNFSGKMKSATTGILKATFVAGSIVFILLYQNVFSYYKNGLAYFMFSIGVSSGVIQLLLVYFVREVPQVEPDPFIPPKLPFDDGDDEESELEGFTLLQLTKMEPVDYSGVRLLKRKTFWMFWLTYAVMQGCGLVVLNGISSLIESNFATGCPTNCNIVIAPETTNKIATAGLLFNIGNGIGRTLMGFTDTLLPSSVVFIGVLFASAAINLVYVEVSASVVIVFLPFFTGMLIGGANTLSALLTAKFFGLVHFGQNYGLVTIAQGVGGTFFTFISGFEYDSKVNCCSNYCLGSNCFSSLFKITSSFCLLGGVLAIVMVLYLKYKERKTQKIINL